LNGIRSASQVSVLPQGQLFVCCQLLVFLQVQRRIAASIQQANVNANMEAAMEFSPESFGQVHMLYINCKVNGHHVKAFVDSGKLVLTLR